MNKTVVIDFGDRKPMSKSDGSKIYKMGENNMDDLLKTYIEKVDRDQSDLREDIRENERRTEKRISETENRMDSRLERIEKMIASQTEKIVSIKDDVNNKMEENKKFMWGIVVSILLSIVASIGVIIATYFSTISLLKDMLVK